MAHYVLGIDPGKNGGLALLDDQKADFIAGMRMPTKRIGKHEYINISAIDYWLEVTCKVWTQGARNGTHCIDQVVIEQVWAMPQQGVSSSFNFGRHYGAVVAYADLLSVDSGGTAWPLLLVPSATWKRVLGITSQKQDSLDLAAMKWPVADIDWCVKANDGIAEAALLAHYHLQTASDLQ